MFNGFTKLLEKLSFVETLQDIVINKSAITQWLIERMAKEKSIAPDDVDIHRSFEQYGLDSIVAVRVVGDLEKFIEQRLSPALLFEFNTISDLSNHLATELGFSEG